MNPMLDRTVLVVDDDAKLLLALKRRLESAGLNVLTATSGADALHLAQTCRPSAITLDVRMPGELDGLAVAAALHQDPATAGIPIIFVTGTADEAFKHRCTTVGARYFLSKPYDGDVLVQMLESIFGCDVLAEMRRISQAKRRQPLGG